ncbi:MAG: methyltransferase [Spirochaetae bacterium HGW-Spirochaetae-1]|jgi:ubiquinone/menaquinone biosynthesis C-methylase UbiE|nr:MAG: methyltransferase [Spirochaetae bacterium HGW-Spirochaetae-1]
MKKSVFDERALQWDTPQRVKLAEIAVTAMRGHVSFNKMMTVLDFAAGTGLITMALQNDVERIVSLDSSQGMLDILKKKLDLYNALNIDIIHGDEGVLGNIHTKFDCIVSSMALHHVEDYKALLKLFHSVLKDNGTVLITDLAKEDGDFHADNTGVYHFGFEEQEIVSGFKAAGFGSVTYDIIHVLNREVKGGIHKDFPIFITAAKK